MVRFYSAHHGRLCQAGSEKSACFIRAIDLQEREAARLSALLNIDNLSFYSIFGQQMPRVEHIGNYVAAIFSVPVSYKQGDSILFNVIPVAMISVDSKWLVISQKASPLLDELVQKIPVWEGVSLQPILFLQQLILAGYDRNLRQIGKITTYLDKRPGGRLQNRKLKELLNQEKSVFCYISALRANEKALLELSAEKFNLSDTEKTLLEHICLEMKRLEGRADTCARLLGSMIEAFSTLASNRLNITLRFFASAIIVMVIFLVAFSLKWVQVPDSPVFNIYFAVILSAVCACCAGWILRMSWLNHHVFAHRKR